MVKEYNEIYQEDLIESSNLLVQYLQDAGFEGNLDDGTGLYDLLIKPTAMLYALFSNKLNIAKSYFSLEHALRNRTELGEEFDVVIDSILSNWFISRKDGLPSTGIIRLLFTKALNEVHIEKSHVFSAQGITYSPIVSKTFNAPDFEPFIELNRKTYYYLDIPVVSTTNTSVALPAKTPFTTTFGNAFYVRAEAFDTFEAGEEIENTDRFIDRAKHAITTRELISEKAIKTALLENIRSVQDVYIAGFGAPEQMRDLKTFQGVELHIGNKADIYLYSNFVRRSLTVTATEDGFLDLSNYPVVHLFSVQNSSALEISGYTLSDIDTEKVWSDFTDFILHSNDFVAGVDYFVDCLVCEEVPVAHGVVFSDLGVVTCFDPLIKSCFPIITSIELNCIINPKVYLTQPDSYWTSKLKSACTSYINSLKRTDTISSSYLISYLHTSVPELSLIQQPFIFDYQCIDPTQINTGLDTALVQVSSDEDFHIKMHINSNAVTKNTTKYYTDDLLITINIVA